MNTTGSYRVVKSIEGYYPLFITLSWFRDDCVFSSFSVFLVGLGRLYALSYNADTVYQFVTYRPRKKIAATGLLIEARVPGTIRQLNWSRNWEGRRLTSPETAGRLQTYMFQPLALSGIRPNGERGLVSVHSRL